MTPRIFWIGDSTVQFNNISTWPPDVKIGTTIFSKKAKK